MPRVRRALSKTPIPSLRTFGVTIQHSMASVEPVALDAGVEQWLVFQSHLHSHGGVLHHVLEPFDAGADEALHRVGVRPQESRRGGDAVAVKVESVVAVEERTDLLRVDTLGLEFERRIEDLSDDCVDFMLREQCLAQLRIDELDLDAGCVEASVLGEGREQLETAITGRGAEGLTFKLLGFAILLA